ncbi:hypothetical protein COOONC_21160 [Cooperia oncophora]
MLLLAVILFQVTLNSWTDGQLQPPKIGSQILYAKLNRTQMYDSKIKEFLKIFDSTTMGIPAQRSRAKAFIASMSNAKVKQATQKVFDDMQNMQDFVWLALNLTNEELGPLLGRPMMPQVMQRHYRSDL